MVDRLDQGRVRGSRHRTGQLHRMASLSATEGSGSLVAHITLRGVADLQVAYRQPCLEYSCGYWMSPVNARGVKVTLSDSEDAAKSVARVVHRRPGALQLALWDVVDDRGCRGCELHRPDRAGAVGLNGLEPARDGFGATPPTPRNWSWLQQGDLAVSYALGCIRSICWSMGLSTPVASARAQEHSCASMSPTKKRLDPSGSEAVRCLHSRRPWRLPSSICCSSRWWSAAFISHQSAEAGVATSLAMMHAAGGPS